MKEKSLRNFFQEFVSLTLGVLLAAFWVGGIRYDGVFAVALVVGVLLVFNVFLRPALTKVLVFLCLPLLVVTFGLAILPILWVVNSVLFFMAGGILAGHGFEVATFWDAMFGAAIVSVTQFLFSVLMNNGRPPRFWDGGGGSGGGGNRRRDSGGGSGGRGRLSQDDVIDV